ncbi:MAG TPA: Gfo/Idh/MocA family oxidoreductase [Acidimicrobiales bacterium]|nr:Gfo/Idh/MocA family oxidoreductase [Acidimicrobiales bacterium]
MAVAGAGAFGLKHLDALQQIEGVEIAAVVSRRIDQAQEVAQTYGAPLATDDLADVLGEPSIEAVILCTPTQLHAEQALATMQAGKHVQIEIPLADRLSDALAVATLAGHTGLTCMVGHTRRFNPSHQWIHQRVLRNEIRVLQMDVQTYFFRRTNTNALGQPRSWTDNLLWHHAAHTVDLFGYQTQSPIEVAHGLAGPNSPDLGIPLDMSLQLKARSGSLCTLSLSFNNEGPLGTFFRYICDNGTYIARYDDLVTGNDEVIDLSGVAVSSNGIELQDREFVAAIREGREPNASVNQVLGCYETLDAIQRELT